MKTKIFTFLLALAASVGTVFASVEINGLYYNLNAEDQTAEVTSQNGKSPYWSTSINSANIPEYVTYGDITYNVTSIGKYAFRNCSALTSIIIPNSVTSIGESAFESCAGLTSVEIPNSFTSIGDLAFYCCSGLTSIEIPNSVTNIGNYAFSSCPGLTSIEIPNSVTNIGAYAFSDCSSLTSVEIPNGVTSIGGSAFSGCSGLVSITIGNNVTSIGDRAFDKCDGLTSVFISDLIAWCNIEFAEHPTANPLCKAHNLYLNGDLVTELTIPDQVTKIKKFAFTHCSMISLSIGTGVTNIGVKAFESCNGLTSVTIPDNVTSIGEKTFYNCSGLTSITIGNSVSTIVNSAFEGCSSITSVTWKAKNCPSYNFGSQVESYIFGDSVNAIPASLCSGMYKLTNITIPNNVVRIGNSAFSGCTGLTSIIIPNSITSIGNSAFSGCTGLTSIIIPNSVTSIGNNAFSSCSGLTSVIWNAKNCADISDKYYAPFYDIRANLTSFTFGDEVEYVPAYLCYEMSQLNSIEIPNSVTSIGDLAFYRCSGLTSIEIPNSVTSIGNNAFSSCTGLTSIIIPNSVTSIGNNAFSSCSGLTSVIWNAKNWGGLHSSDYYPFYDIRTNIMSFTFGDEVEHIPAELCSGMSNLNSIKIPNNVTSIGSSAFSGCTGLTSVTIGNNVTSIGKYAFSGCSSLTSVEIPNSVTSIGYSAFHGCSGLTSVTIGNSVTTIGSTVFYGCSNLTSITIPNRVKSIENSTFYDCTSLSTVVIGDSVASIGDYAFYNCSSLTSMTIEAETPPTRGYNVFKGTSSFDIYVPCGTLDTYKSKWSSYASKIKYVSFSITTNAQNGAITIEPDELTICSDKTLTATPDYGYHFTQWSDGNTDNPRTLVLTKDTVFTAEFAKNSYSIFTESANSELGTTEGDKTALYLDAVEISAIANYGYRFSQWNDGNTDNPRTIILTQDTSFTASFAKNTYFITKNAANGNISGYSFAEYMDEVTLTVTPDYGYHFTQWSDGSTDNPRTFVLTQDTTFTAEFAPKKYNVSISRDLDNGTIEGESGEFDYLTELTYIAIAEYGYHLDHWNVIKEYIFDNDQFEDVGNNLLWDYTESAPQSNPDRGLSYASKVNDSNLKGIKLNSSGYCSFTKNAVTGILKLTFSPRYSGSSSLRVKVGEGDSESYIITEEASTLTTVSIPLTAEQNNIYITRSAAVETVLQKIQFIETRKTYAKEDTISIVVVGDTTVQAFFVKNSYQIIDNTNKQEGYISGAGYYSYLDTVKLTAIPNNGYHFKQWSDGIKENPREVILTQDSMFVAQFEIVNSGTCGEDNMLTWTYDNESKTLTISGSGALTSNYTYGAEAPSQMQNLIIGNEVTEIGDSAFYEMSTINHLIIGGGVATIGEYAFAECRNFDDITSYATTVPTIYETTFNNVGNKQYIFLYVPEGRQRAYLRDTYWGEFDVQVKNAEAVTEPTEGVVITPSDNSAEIVWPVVNGAETYDIVITKDNQAVCTLTFNAQGQLSGIAFAPARETEKQQVEGFRFTITGLTSNTQYGYSIVSKDAGSNSLDTKSGSFKTTGEIATTVENVQENNIERTKVIRDGHIFILLGEQVYTITGQEAK